MNVVPYEEAMRRIALPLDIKIQMSIERIREWYEAWDGQVAVSFSGGRDSTALLHLVRSIYSEVPAVFANTGLEFPEIVRFVKETPNVVVIRPEMPFHQVVKKYGWPVVTKRVATQLYEARTYVGAGHTYRLRTTGYKSDGTFSKLGMIPAKWQYLIKAPFPISSKCCDVMKKRPFDRFVKQTGLMPYTGTMATEGKQRFLNYLARGCNSYEATKHNPVSAPMAFWTKEDVLLYLDAHRVPYSPIYDMGYPRTGCVFCCFGVHLEKSPNRFERLYETHPRLWRYCMDKLGLREVLRTLNVSAEIRQREIQWGDT